MLPIQVRHSSVSDFSKVLYSEIYDLAQLNVRRTGDPAACFCYAKDEHFADVLHKSTKTVKRGIKELKDASFVRAISTPIMGGGTARRLYVANAILSDAEVERIKMDLKLRGRYLNPKFHGRVTSVPSDGRVTDVPSYIERNPYILKGKPLSEAAERAPLTKHAFKKTLEANPELLAIIFESLNASNIYALTLSINKFFLSVNSERTLSEWLVKLNGWLVQECRDLTSDLKISALDRIAIARLILSNTIL